MKNKVIPVVCTMMLFIPWTILPLRTLDWALEAPAAGIIIACYAAFMIASGLFTIFSYTRGNIKSRWMQVCAIINGIYGVGGIAALLLMLPNLL